MLQMTGLTQRCICCPENPQMCTPVFCRQCAVCSLLLLQKCWAATVDRACVGRGGKPRSLRLMISVATHPVLGASCELQGSLGRTIVWSAAILKAKKESSACLFLPSRCHIYHLLAEGGSGYLVFTGSGWVRCGEVRRRFGPLLLPFHSWPQSQCAACFAHTQ